MAYRDCRLTCTLETLLLTYLYQKQPILSPVQAMQKSLQW